MSFLNYLEVENREGFTSVGSIMNLKLSLSILNLLKHRLLQDWEAVKVYG